MSKVIGHFVSSNGINITECLADTTQEEKEETIRTVREIVMRSMERKKKGTGEKQYG